MDKENCRTRPSLWRPVTEPVRIGFEKFNSLTPYDVLLNSPKLSLQFHCKKVGRIFFHLR